MTDEQRLIEISEKLGKISADINHLNSNTNKVMMSLIGVIAASIGMKLIGSPPLTDLFAFASMFAFVFLVGGTILTWGKTNNPRKFVRLAFASFLFFSVFMRTFVFESGVTPAPVWYAPTIDVFFVILSVSLILSIWKDKNI